jgi:hypothetical protein
MGIAIGTLAAISVARIIKIGVALLTVCLPLKT